MQGGIVSLVTSERSDSPVYGWASMAAASTHVLHAAPTLHTLDSNYHLTPRYAPFSVIVQTPARSVYEELSMV